MASKMIRQLGNHCHLADLQEFGKTFLVFVYSDTCKPCQRLKPLLFKKAQDAKLDMYMIPRTQDEHVNIQLQVGKIPHVAVVKDGQLRGGIQNSDIGVTWPYVEECLAEFNIEEDF